MPSTVWFDRPKISPLYDEDMESIMASHARLRELVNQEVKKGIPRERIIMGGLLK